MNKNHDDDCPLCAELAASGAEMVEVDLLALFCEQVEEMIEEEDWENAESTARMILESFPEEVAGFERLARVYEAKGDFGLAKRYLQKSISFLRATPGYPESMREDLRERLQTVKEMESKASKAGWH
jgi:hypothetical protein